MIRGGDYIHLASKWSLLNRAGEPTWRSAISRAYYGAFHCAQEFLFEDLGITELKSGKTGSKHFMVQQLLKYTDQPVAIEAAHRLEALREHRNSADYDLDDGSAGTQTLSKHAHWEAVKISDLLRQCAGLDDRAKDEMRTNIEKSRKIRGI